MAEDAAAQLDALYAGFRTRYLDYDELTQQLRSWAEAWPELVRLESIGESGEGRSIWLLTLGRDPDRRRPAAWVDGNMHASELAGSAAALQVAEDVLRLHLAPDAASVTGAVADAVREGLVYVLPRMSPDGAEEVSRRGHFVRSVPADDPVETDRPRWLPQDLDGDGRCLWMRMEDPTGEYVDAPEAPGMLVPRRLEDEGPFYKLYPEGVIEGFDGVTVPSPTILDGGTPDLNRNFPFKWEPEPTQLGAGPHPMATPEARAVVEWASRHPEIFVWLNLHTFGGVFIRPLGDQPDTKLDPLDLAIWRELGASAEAHTGYPMVSAFEEFTYAPETPLHGTLSEWAWAHRGAWGHVCELWDFFHRLGKERPKRFVDHYTRLTRRDLIRIVQWDAEENRGRMRQPWAPVQHPQLGAVEVGGFDPRIGIWNPPLEGLAEVVQGLSRYFLETAARLPRLHFETKVEALGPALWRVELTVENRGYLSTLGPEAAKGLPFAEPLWAQAKGEEGARLASPAEARVQLGHLDGWGRGREGGAETIHILRSRGSTGRAHARWHVAGPGALRVRFGSPRVGHHDLRLPLRNWGQEPISAS